MPPFKGVKKKKNDPSPWSEIGNNVGLQSIIQYQLTLQTMLATNKHSPKKSVNHF